MLYEVITAIRKSLEAKLNELLAAQPEEAVAETCPDENA